MTASEWWEKVENICKEQGVSFDSDEAYNAAMNTTTIDDEGIHHEVFTEDSLSIFAAGLDSILNEGE